MTDIHGIDELMIPVRPDQLDPGAVIAQSLDNQWVSAQLTEEMIRAGKSLRQVADQRNTQVRAEYFRGLINAEQVVVNRAFFYNNRAISQDLIEGGEAREAHRKLLTSGALVPYLIAERHPAEQPASYLHVDAAGYAAWRDTFEQMSATDRVRCVRMSWDDQENRDRTRARLFRPFAAKVQGLTALDLDLLAGQVGVPAEEYGAFRRRLGELVSFSNDLNVRGESVVRNVLYEEFVTVPGSNVADGEYDGSKPFAAQIKQLLDLLYSVNLADALGRYPLTPQGSLRRLVLQEVRDVRDDPEVVRDPEALFLFLQKQAFGVVQDHLTPSNVDGLTLGDVWSLRQSGDWNAYIRAFGALSADPLAFHEHVGRVFDRYVQLNRTIVKLAAARRQRVGSSRWSPVIEVVVTLGGSVFTAITADQTWEVLGSIAPLAAGPVGGSVQLVLRNRREGMREQRFAREIARVRLESEHEWAQFHDLVSRLSAYRESAAAPPQATASTTTQDNDDLYEW
ncbi:hypothetical protein ACFOZ0_14575 [Streptomyces yaanensis]|uniref:Uncharacterized protein n=1 Tax=Streptomyces yaanensis TaxID=1142239 RepID=A0ABV7SC01_9ACTN|nr:hypothetical protein [Streptomyces sp. CGMCC 4.7035]WNB98689.1 hypothetical protein Q2K21_11735 [Streptomyces sp. CGMCC 4.7035]